MKKDERLEGFKSLVKEKIQAVNGTPCFLACVNHDAYCATIIAEDSVNKGRLYIGECYEAKGTLNCLLRIFKEV